MNVRRFFYVHSTRGAYKHIQFGRLTEGEKLACGIRQRQGWKWATPVTTFRKLPVCPLCLKKIKSEKVRASRRNRV